MGLILNYYLALLFVGGYGQHQNEHGQDHPVAVVAARVRGQGSKHRRAQLRANQRVVWREHLRHVVRVHLASGHDPQHVQRRQKSAHVND